MKIAISARANPRVACLVGWGRGAAVVGLASLMAQSFLLAQSLPRFREEIVTKEIKFGYQLVAVDLNGDGKKDLIAVDERATELAWFENPTWARHVLATNVPRPLNVACCDLDGDGVPEVVLAYRFKPARGQRRQRDPVHAWQGRAPAVDGARDRSRADGAPGPLD